MNKMLKIVLNLLLVSLTIKIKLNGIWNHLHENNGSSSHFRCQSQKNYPKNIEESTHLILRQFDKIAFSRARSSKLGIKQTIKYMKNRLKCLLHRKASEIPWLCKFTKRFYLARHKTAIQLSDWFLMKLKFREEIKILSLIWPNWRSSQRKAILDINRINLLQNIFILSFDSSQEQSPTIQIWLSPQRSRKLIIYY